MTTSDDIFDVLLRSRKWRRLSRGTWSFDLSPLLRKHGVIEKSRHVSLFVNRGSPPRGSHYQMGSRTNVIRVTAPASEDEPRAILLAGRGTFDHEFSHLLDSVSGVKYEQPYVRPGEDPFARGYYGHPSEVKARLYEFEHWFRRQPPEDRRRMRRDPRDAVVTYLRGKGYPEHDAEDISWFMTLKSIRAAMGVDK